MNKKCVAMLLAGGQGSRLYALTSKIAKPAVPFGAKYRIIDFPLSNCINSKIDTVGVLTQYQPLILNEYIGNGQPWDLDRNYGGVHILPPYQAKANAEWYKGTANAIYQNLHFMQKYNPTHILILSGDHIYKMDYNKMLIFHEQHDADCTISVIEVPLIDASRFGIMNCDENGKIIEFSEKPKVPKSNKASMGIYIFKAEVLYKYLTDDENDKNSSKDFGNDIIPKMLSDGRKMMSYMFSGYWKDVGTVKSLWDANMDLLGSNPAFDIDTDWKIYSRSPIKPPHYIAAEANVSNSLIAGGCEIFGNVKNSIISSGAKVLKGATVLNSVIMENVTVNENSVVEYSIVDENATIGKKAKVGKVNDDSKIAVIGRNTEIQNNAGIDAGANIEM